VLGKVGLDLGHAYAGPVLEPRLAEVVHDVVETAIAHALGSRPGPVRYVDVEREKRAAAEAAVELVEDGMTVGLGTGSTVGYLLRSLALRGLDVRCIATSGGTEQAGRQLGLVIAPFDRLDRLDIAIDGADQIDPAGWLIKGGGAAHTREKIVALAAERFVVIASSDKLVEALAPPVPLELLAFGVAATVRALAPARLRDVPPSPDGGLIADYLGAVDDAAELASRLASTPGVIEHGLFPPDLVSDILVARGTSVERRRPADR
jgi:ribose 5-phosphate isomerase A